MNKPTIAELEAILNSDDHRNIEITPDGQVKTLSPDESMLKSLQYERERNALLRKEVDRLRRLLTDIRNLTEKR